jgi:hypothetical protein
MKKRKRNQFEKKLDEYNHTMELIRTVIPFFYFGNTDYYF